MLSSPSQAISNTDAADQPVRSKGKQQHGAPAPALNASASEFVPGGVRRQPDTGQQLHNTGPQQQPQQGGRGHHKGGRGGASRGGRREGGGGRGGGLSRALQDGAARDSSSSQHSPRPHHGQHHRQHQQHQQRRGQPQQQQQQRDAAGDGAQLDQQRQPASQDQQQTQQRQSTPRSNGAEQEGDAARQSSNAARPPGPAGRGRQVTANHLLNFQYESRGPPRGGRGGRGGGPGSYSGGRRRPPAYRPQRYDKDKFLQANFRFLVSSAVDTKQFDADADRMFDWEDVIMVDMRSATPVQCPISLDSPPVCPQITPCGHVFSFGSIMRHLMTHGGEQLRRSAPCPLCYQALVARELRLVQIHHVQPMAVGDTITFRLLRRPKGSIIPVPVTEAAAEEADRATPEPPHSSSTAAAGAGADGATGCSLDSTSSSSSALNASKWAARKAAAAAAATTPGVRGSYASVSTPLSENLFAKFATLADPRPLWRAAVQELGQQLAEVLEQGGLEADFEAPGLFAAADCLAHRARRFAEHQATQLLQRGVPVGATTAAAAAGTAVAGWPVWLASDPQVAGAEADALIRDAFTVAIDSGKAALKTAEQEQQVAAAFPSLAAAAVGGRAAGGAAGSPSSPEARSRQDVPPQPQQQEQQQQQGTSSSVRGGVAVSSARSGPSSLGSSGSQVPPQPQQSVVAPVNPEASFMERQSSRPELFFDHAFSEDEEDEAPSGQAPDIQQLAAPAADSTPAAAGHSRPQDIPAATSGGGGDAGTAATLFGTSPGTAGLLGSSPVSSAMNTASLSGDYFMYQAADGQWLFLHPLNLRCLLHAFGSYAACPPTVTGKVLELEDMVQDEGSRRRWKFLGHLPLHGTFRLGEVTFTQPHLSQAQLAPLVEELAAREKRRRRRAEAARRESRREAAAAAAAAKARQGPSAAELRSMPRLGQAELAGVDGAAGSSSGSGLPADLQGLSPEQLEEALAAQAMHDSAAEAAYGASPPPSGVSFARIAELGFAATGPALGSSPAAAGSSGSNGPAVGAAGGGAALKGAWEAASSSGKSAAARLSTGPAGGGSSTGGGAAAAAALLSKSSWGASVGAVRSTSSGAEGGAAGSSSSAAGSQQWLVLGGGKEGGAREAGAGDGAGEGSASGLATTSSSGGSGKKSKKGMVLFATGQQRKY